MPQENYKKSPQEGRYVTFLKIPLKVCSDSLLSYSHPKSKHTYKFPFTSVLLKIYTKYIGKALKNL